MSLEFKVHVLVIASSLSEVVYHIFVKGLGSMFKKALCALENSFTWIPDLWTSSYIIPMPP